MKKSRVTNGIPVVLCYDTSNLTIMPTDSITGSNKFELYQFFNRVSSRITHINNNAIK
jgi:hypothetical protein